LNEQLQYNTPPQSKEQKKALNWQIQNDESKKTQKLITLQQLSSTFQHKLTQLRKDSNTELNKLIKPVSGKYSVIGSDKSLQL
jgi:hypothetical protein